MPGIYTVLPFLGGFVTTKHKNRGGRPKGIMRCTCVRHGAYTGTERIGDVLTFWKKHKPGMAARVGSIIQKYTRALGWSADHERCKEIRDLAILTVSRSALFMIVVNADFTRTVKDPTTGKPIRQRPAEQFRRLEELDEEIQARLEKLGLLSKK